MKPWAKAGVQGGACGLVLGMVVLIGGRLWQPQVVVPQAKQPAVADVLRARRFELVDAAENKRATLFLGENAAPGLHLWDAAGKVRASLASTEGGAPALLLDTDGMGGAALALTEGGAPVLYLMEGPDNARAGLVPKVTLRDAVGEFRAVLASIRLETRSTGDATMRPESPLVLSDRDRNVIWEAP